MLKLLVEVVYSVCGLWGSHRTVECVRASVGLDDVWFRRPFCGSCGDNPEWKGHHFRWLSWVGVQFFVCGGVGHMFLNFTDISPGSGGIEVEDLQYVGRLVVSGWCLKWNCFFMVWMRQVADFCMRWCVEAGGVGTKLRPRARTSVSILDRWWEERFLMALFLKFV